MPLTGSGFMISWHLMIGRLGLPGGRRLVFVAKFTLQANPAENTKPVNAVKSTQYAPLNTQYCRKFFEFSTKNAVSFAQISKFLKIFFIPY